MPVKAPNKLDDALMSVFDEKDFDKLLVETLKKSPSQLVPHQKLVTCVVKSAREHGWTNSLIEAALKHKPHDPVLKEFALIDPLESLIAKPPNKSKASGGEVDRALQALVLILEGSEGQLSHTMFTELNSCLTDLYAEYHAQVAATIA